MTTPLWQAAENGIPGHLSAANQSAQVDQLLAAHQVMPIYQGVQVLTPAGGTQFDSALRYGGTHDLDQPFVLSGTSVGRVVIPVIPFGNGADLLVTLCPDNGSGAPLTSSPIAATAVPAAAIAQLAAIDGLENATGPLQVPAFNAMYCTGSIVGSPWAGPTGDFTGLAQNAVQAVSGSYFIFAGGFTTAPVAGVSTAQYLGGGQMGLPIAQPSLPQANFFGSVTTTSTSVIYLGGSTATVVLSAVWVASWDPNTGLIGSWSQQSSLPVAVQSAGSATWNDSVVYCLGGSNFSGTPTAAVYFASIGNGQVGSWVAGPSLPTALAAPMVAVVGNTLLAIGGQVSSTVPSSAVYYSAINPATGALGPWQVGPPLPTGVYPYASGWDVAVTDSAVVVVGGVLSGGSLGSGYIQSLTVTADGLAPAWEISQWKQPGVFQVGAFAVGSGQWDLVNPNIPASEAWKTTLTPAPYVSIPLYATGLTSGSTYHLVMQQHQNATAADFLAFCVLDAQPLPLNALKAARHSGVWTAVAATWSVPMSVYDASASGPVWHTWEDPNGYSCAQRTSTLLYSQQQLPIGVVEQTLKANPPRNANPTFTSGITPWTATGGTLTQSSAQTHGGYAFSGLLTPSGTAASATALSELFPVSQGGGPFYGSSSWYLVDGWLYSTPGYTNVSLSVAWYDQSSNLISTSSTAQALTAATWTHVQNWYLAPAQAAFGQIQATEGGTPAASKLLYLSDVFFIASQECVGSLTSAAAIEYPPGAYWPPVGVEQLL